MLHVLNSFADVLYDIIFSLQVDPGYQEILYTLYFDDGISYLTRTHPTPNLVPLCEVPLHIFRLLLVLENNYLPIFRGLCNNITFSSGLIFEKQFTE